MGYKVTIEVPLFFTVFGFMLTLSVGNNLLIYRTCYVLLGYNKTECALLGFVDNNVTEKLERLVEPTSDYIALVKNIVDTVLGSVLCLFIAPWSDRFGRKPILVIGFVGGTISMLFHIGFAAWDELSPWYLLIFSIPVLLTGGGASFMTILSAYLTDSTTKEERGFRLGLFDVVLQIAVLLGNSLSSYLLLYTNYVIVYCISAACHLLGLVFTIYFVPESLQERESENKVTEFFNISNFKQMIKTPFKSRENSKRKILLLIMVVLMFTYLADGSRNINFYFLREKFHWTLTQLTWFGSASMLLGIAGTFVIVYLLHTVLRIKESVLVCVGFLFSVASATFTGFAVTDWQIYLAAIINLPSSGDNALTRSLISKLVNEDENAKIFSAFGVASTILGPLSSAGYTALYNATINTDPGIFNFVTACILFCPAILFMIILIIQRKTAQNDYNVLENDQINDVNAATDNFTSSAVQVNHNPIAT